MKKLKDINWNQVYYFYEVARKMSMKEAAEVTGVSIPTVSEQIKRLETLLETPLFHRLMQKSPVFQDFGREQGEIARGFRGEIIVSGGHRKLLAGQ